MKRLNDPKLQRLLGYVAADTHLNADARQQLTHDLMAIDQELTAARELAHKPAPAPSKGAR